MRTPRALLLPLACLSLLAGLAPPGAAQTAEELLDQIRQGGRRMNSQLFDRLAGLRTRESLEAMQRAVLVPGRTEGIDRAFRAFGAYLGVDGLERDAIEYLHDEARSGQDALSRGAVVGLGQFGARAEEELRDLTENGKDGIVRARAAGYLLPLAAAAGRAADLGPILDNARVGESGTLAELVGQLAAFRSAEALELMAGSLRDEEVAASLRIALIELLAGREDPAAERALLGALRAESPSVQLAALEALETRGTTAHVKELQRLLKSKDAAVRRQALAGLGRIRGVEPAWWRQLVRLARAKDPATRQGAAIALASMRTPEALELLYLELLADPDRAVRAEALQQVGNLRRADSIPVLIGRLNAESGRLKVDLMTVLRLVTGEDHGSSYERWKRWWEAEGAAFEVPAYEDALRAEEERRAHASDGRTLTSFYGLQVVSDRVSFVLDVSGSMARPSRGGRSKIEAAKQELSAFIDAYPNGDLFNLVFFASDVFPWQDGLVPMTQKLKKAALAYVGRQGANGGTAVYDALKLAFEDRRVDTLVLLTDGQPEGGTIDDVAEIAAEVRRWNRTRRIRIHGVSIGRDSRLLRELAQDSGGEYRQVQ